MLKLFNNQSVQKDILCLIILKVSFSIFIYYLLAVVLQQNMFLYPDFTKIYSDCSQLYSNILYTKFLCSISYITSKPFSPESLVAIILAALVNSFIIAYYYKSLYSFLTRNGQILLIMLLAFHPYISIYFFRFYTEIFACLGILLIFSSAIKNKDIDFIFIVLALIFMNFRNALIPVFFVYGSYEIIKNYYNKSYRMAPLVLLIVCFISYIPALSFSIYFSDLRKEFSILSNIFYTLGFRESVGINGIGTLLKLGFIGYMQILLSLFLLCIHATGFVGILKFSLQKNISLMICFTYLVAPILVISHMRFLLPLMPILLFGFTFIFFKKNAPLK